MSFKLTRRRLPASYGIGMALLFLGACTGAEPAPDPQEGLGGAQAELMTCSKAADCPEAFCSGVQACDPERDDADEFGCVMVEEPCADGEICDEARQACRPDCEDSDSDGDGHVSIACGGDDCDDENGLRYPGAEETCDVANVDEDCDPRTFGVRDADNDGYADAICCNEDDEGTPYCGEDCNDARRNVHPDAPDTCNGVDEDCDGEVDEDGEQVVVYPDCDGDGFGRAEASATSGCAPTETPEECNGDSAGWSPVDTDCDDTRASVGPGLAEVCDGLDNDCDEDTWSADEDDDGDGFPDAECGGTDCDDECATCFPGGHPEICDGLDHNCNGETDEGVPEEDFLTFYQDSDGDGLGVENNILLACSAVLLEYADVAGDCNDSDSLTGICAAPLLCRAGAICGCQTGSIYNNAEYVDLDTGTTSVPDPSGGSDVIVNNGELGRMHLSVRTGVTWRRLDGRTFSSVTLADAGAITSTGEDPLEWVHGPEGTVYLVRTGAGHVYKLGHFETPEGGGISFAYAPLGELADGFICLE